MLLRIASLHIPSSFLLTFLLFIGSSAHAQRDTTGVIMCLATGLRYEATDVAALNARLDAAGLHHASAVPLRVGADILFSGNRTVFQLGENAGFAQEGTDSSRISTSIFNLHFSYGYPLLRTSHTLLAPMVGYRFSAFTYAHYPEANDPTFNGILRGNDDQVQFDHTQHELMMGALWTTGRWLCFTLQGGYIVPLGSGAWHATGTGDKLLYGPRLAPGFYVSGSLVLRFNLHPERWLPSC